MEIYQLGYYISKEYQTQKITPKREVFCSEIEFYTTQGSTSIVNGEKFVQEKCNILVSKCGDIRYSIDDFECFAVHFSDSEIDPLLNKLPTVFKVFDSNAVLNIFKEMTSSYTKGTDSGILLAKAKILELLSVLISENAKLQNEKFLRYSDNVFSACDFIDKNFQTHITLSDIATKVHLSPSFFHTVFKSATGITPSEYLLNTRLQNAKNMLLNSNHSLVDIAIACGFESQAYFCYVFKKHIGSTPKKYRDTKQLIL